MGSGWSKQSILTYGLTLEGIRYLFNKHEENIPVIGNRHQLMKFIDDIPVGQKAVAVVEQQAFKGNDEGDLLHVYAICYEKKVDKDVFYSYDSFAASYLSVEPFSSRTCEIYVPRQQRQSSEEATCHAYAMMDARILQEMVLVENSRGRYPDNLIQEGISLGYRLGESLYSLFIHKESAPRVTKRFELSSQFEYDAHRIKQDLLVELIEDVASSNAEIKCRAII